jgi:thiamine-phosphate pyrophosphorylase
MKALDLCVITRQVERLGRSHVDVARAALQGGAPAIQLREKSVSDRALWELAQELRRLAREHGALFIVNDHVDIAAAVEADGVHLGEDDLPIAEARRILGPDAIVGASVANPQEALSAEAEGADYVSVGPVFATTSKPDAGDAIGVAPIAEIKRTVARPVLAIGGINCENVDAAIAAGADGIAVISAVAEAENMAAATAELLRLVREGQRHGNEQEQFDDTA